MRNKTVIITGASGQIGSYLIDFLLEKGLIVIGTVRWSFRKSHTNNPNFILELMDLEGSEAINTIVNKYKPNYFINCAASNNPESSWYKPTKYFDCNVAGVIKQLEAIKTFSPHTRYVNLGSAEEFGDAIYSPQDADHPARTRNPYGASKVASRQIVRAYRAKYGLYALQPWCYNCESPRRGSEFVTRKITMGVARIVEAIKEGKSFEPIELGNLDAQRDWSHAKDFVEGIWMMLNQNKFVPKYNRSVKEYILSSGEAHTIREFVEKAFKYAGIETKWSYRGTVGYVIPPENEVVEDLNSNVLVKINPDFYRPTETNVLLGDSTPIRKELGWTPKYSFDDLVKDMVTNDINLLTKNQSSDMLPP
jgi:GDPmannose 4,6-dehydratase